MRERLVGNVDTRWLIWWVYLRVVLQPILGVVLLVSLLKIWDAWDCGPNGACRSSWRNPAVRRTHSSHFLVAHMDVFLRRHGPPVHAKVPARHHSNSPAGLSAMVYTTNLHILAAESKLEGEGGSHSKDERRDKIRDRSNKRDSFIDDDPTKALFNWGEPENRHEYPEYHMAREDIWDEHANYGEERMDTIKGIKRPYGDGRRPDDIRSELETDMADDKGHPGELHHEESGDPGKTERDQHRMKQRPTSWQEKLNWVSSPVRRLLKPYTSWKLGEFNLDKKVDADQLRTKKFKHPIGKTARWLQRKLKAKCTTSPRWRRKAKSKENHHGKGRSKGENDKTDNYKDFEKNFFATTSWKPRESRRKTVRRILGIESPGQRNRQLFNVESFTKLASTLKNENYKAIKPYLIEAKMMHLDVGGEWSMAWDRKFKLCMRAAARGSGPAKKAKEVRKELWAEDTTKCQGKDAAKPKKKVTISDSMAKAASAVATQWMLREIELSALHRDDVHFDQKKKMVTMVLRRSKTDTEAKGTTRVLQCTCNDVCGWECPYEATWRLAHGRGEKTKAQLLENGPLVTSVQGKKVRKCDIVNAWKSLYGEEVSGHSPRRTGALQYIRAGWAISQVAYLGRWKSQVIYEYAREALESIPVNIGTTFESKRTDQCHWEEGSLARTKPIEEEYGGDQEVWRKEKMGELELELEAVKLDCSGMRKKLTEEVAALEKKADSRKGLLPNLVFSGRAQLLHLNEDIALCSPPYTWKTVCGWRYNGANFTLQNGSRDEITCTKCKNIANIRGGSLAMKGSGMWDFEMQATGTDKHVAIDQKQWATNLRKRLSRYGLSRKKQGTCGLFLKDKKWGTVCAILAQALGLGQESKFWTRCHPPWKKGR